MSDSIVQKQCNKCHCLKPLSCFNKTHGRRVATCRTCTRHQFSKYYSTPRGRAVNAWHRIKRRVKHSEHYYHVQIRMTRDEFLAWAVPRFERWMSEHPDITPSIDRKDPRGHYELSNLRLLSLAENCRQATRNKNIYAPSGMGWCGSCKAYYPLSRFHRDKNSPNGRTGRCKDCVRNYQMEYYSRKRQSNDSQDVN